MRTLFWQCITSLDGFMEGPDGTLDWFRGGPDFERYVADVLGSVGGDAAAMNGLPKVVFSRTLPAGALPWSNARLAGPDTVAEVRALKETPGGPLALFASADLAATLLAHGLIDEVRVLVMPVVLGTGKPMFADGARRRLALHDVARLDAGTVALVYRPG